MAVRGSSPLLVVIPLWMSFGSAAAVTEQHVCYVLDSVLFLYGIILTVLYCRMKIMKAKEATAETPKAKQIAAEAIYTGLTAHTQDTYETIGLKK